MLHGERVGPQRVVEHVGERGERPEQRNADLRVRPPRQGAELQRRRAARAVDRLLRSLDVPFAVGERIARRDFTAEVRAVTPDGRPAQVAFHFGAPLESPTFRWLAWGASGVETFRLPAVGARVQVPRAGLRRCSAWWRATECRLLTPDAAAAASSASA
jgi:hypothetical protein